MRVVFHKRGLLLVSVVALCLGTSVAWPAGGGGSASSSQTADVLKRFVFTVNAFSRVIPDSSGAPGDAKTRWKKNVGTAFPVGDGGYLVTLNCVVRNAEKIVIVGSNGARYEASVVGFDKGARLTVLKLSRPASVPTPRIRPVNSVKTGASIVFLGTSSGGALELTQGSVNSIRPQDGLMVVDVSGYPGTSGTPVFDGDGQAVGLLAYRLEEKTAEGGHQAGKESYIVLPLEYASLQARSVINRFESRSGWLGISLSASGTAVRGIIPGSPAEKCGIRAGDRVVEFNGATIANPGDLVRATGATRAGDTVRIKVMRNGEAVSVSAKLMQFPDAGD